MYCNLAVGAAEGARTGATLDEGAASENRTESYLAVAARLAALKSFYMVSDRGYVKSQEAAFDGTNKIFEDFLFDMENQMTYTAMAGKREAERQALATIIAISTTMTI